MSRVGVVISLARDRNASILALFYVVTATAYIFLSGELAASTAGTVEDLQRTELKKGLIFVSVTGGALFLLALILFRRTATSARALLASREAFCEAERRATAALFAASIAHDFRNVLMVLQTAVAQLGQEGIEQELLGDMHSAIKRGTELADRLAKSSRGTAAGETERVYLAPIISEALDLIRLHEKSRGCSIELRATQPLFVTVYPSLIHQIVVNLVMNAVEALDGHGRVEIDVRSRDDAVVLEVHDDGPGVPKEEREGLFCPFRTSKPEGTGLGLVSVKTCAEMHGGYIEIEDSWLGGACFRAVFRSPG